MYIHEDIAADKRLTLGSPYSAILLSAVAARRLSRVLTGTTVRGHLKPKDAERI